MPLPLMTSSRWMVCVAFCAFVLGAGMAFHSWVNARLDATLREARKAAGLPLDTPIEDIGIEVAADLMSWIQIDHLLLKFWFVLLPLVLLIGLGLACLIPSKQGVPRTRPPSAISREG